MASNSMNNGGRDRDRHFDDNWILIVVLVLVLVVVLVIALVLRVMTNV